MSNKIQISIIKDELRNLLISNEGLEGQDCLDLMEMIQEFAVLLGRKMRGDSFEEEKKSHFGDLT